MATPSSAIFSSLRSAEIPIKTKKPPIPQNIAIKKTPMKISVPSPDAAPAAIRPMPITAPSTTKSSPSHLKIVFVFIYASSCTKAINSLTSSMVLSLTVYMTRPICGQFTGGISSCMTMASPYLAMISSWVCT